MIRQVVPNHWQAALRDYLMEYERLHDDYVHIFPGILETLQHLRNRGVRLAIVTGKGRESCQISLHRLRLDHYFERIEVGSPEGPIKPMGLRAVLAAWNAHPEVCAYVGDAAYDMAVAAEVGVIGLGAAWAATASLQETTVPPPGAIFTQVGELVTWIDRFVSPAQSG